MDRIAKTLKRVERARCVAVKAWETEPTKPKPMKPRKGWVVVTPGGRAALETMRTYKYEARDEGIWFFMNIRQDAWFELYEQGYRLMRVALQEAADGP